MRNLCYINIINMAKEKIEFNITVNFIKEGNKFIAYSQAFDLSTCGKTLEEAKKGLRK